MSVTKLTEKYHAEKARIKTEFISKVTSILSSKVKKKAAIELGIEELAAEQYVNEEEIAEIRNVLKENV